MNSRHLIVDEAFARVEESILPSLSSSLEMLLDAALLSRPGADAEAHAAQLRRVAAQLQALTREVESTFPGTHGPQAWKDASAA